MRRFAQKDEAGFPDPLHQGVEVPGARNGVDASRICPIEAGLASGSTRPRLAAFTMVNLLSSGN